MCCLAAFLRLCTNTYCSAIQIVRFTSIESTISMGRDRQTDGGRVRCIPDEFTHNELMLLVPSTFFKDKQYIVKTFFSPVLTNCIFLIHLRLLLGINTHLAGYSLQTLLSVPILRIRIAAFQPVLFSMVPKYQQVC